MTRVGSQSHRGKKKTICILKTAVAVKCAVSKPVIRNWWRQMSFGIWDFFYFGKVIRLIYHTLRNVPSKVWGNTPL